MKKNLFLLLVIAFFFGTSASVYAAQVESEDSTVPVTAAVLDATVISTPDFEYTINAFDGATVTVPINTPHLAVISTPWMIGSKARTSVRYVFNYDEWIRYDKPNVFNGIIIGTDNKRYTVRIHISSI